MKGYETKFETKDTQHIQITIYPRYGNNFVDRYDREEFIDDIAATVANNLEGADVRKYQIEDTDIGMITEKHHPYYISLVITVAVTGTCMFYPGKYYGPWEDSYPDEVDDVEYTQGFATTYDTSDILKELEDGIVYLDNIEINIDEPSYESELEFIDDDDF